MGKDYYKILDVDKKANQDEIKRAFRKLAHKYHPDKESGDEAKFKEINEAYQILSKPEKREQYDQYGSTFDQQGGFGGGMNWQDFMKYARGGNGSFQGANFNFGDLGDVFGDLFGFGGQRGSRNRTRVGRDIGVDLQIDFKEAVFGTKKTLNLYKNIKCSKCGGDGIEPGSKMNTCSSCNGQGKTVRQQRTFLGVIQSEAICSNCEGRGQIPENKCSKCSGAGTEKQESKIQIDVPAGIDNGMTLKLPGQGEAVGGAGSRSGDLYVTIRVKEDERFQRQNNDIYYQAPISFVQAILGDKIDVPTLDGAVDLKIPAGTQPKTKFRLKNKGIPYMNRSGRGDFYVIAEVEIPKKVSRKQRKLLEEF